MFLSQSGPIGEARVPATGSLITEFSGCLVARFAAVDMELVPIAPMSGEGRGVVATTQQFHDRVEELIGPTVFSTAEVLSLRAAPLSPLA